jgi:RNA polymerase sigma-70 factor (sigma-E family)
MRAGTEPVRIDRNVLAELYARHANEALRLAYLLTGDASAAEDLVQDAFVRMTGRLLHLRNPGGFHAYLRVTVVNLSRSYHRRRKIERGYAERQVAPDAAMPPDLSDREELRDALMSLPIRQRTAVVLRYCEDLSETQTAELMRCRPTAVRSLVARGVGTLRGSLKEGD